jgi:hypothetical protein
VEVASAGSEGRVRVAEELGALVELAKLLNVTLGDPWVKQGATTSIRTRERLSTSSFRRTSKRAACWSACLCREATSGGLNTFTASLAFHPLGSCSNARLSELLLLLEPVRFRVAQKSDLFRGRPLSMMLPDSDWCLLCPKVAVCIGSPSSVWGVHMVLGTVGSGVAVTARGAGLSHGLGDALCSTGADNGVGNVEAVMTVVAADLGVVNEAESGVKGVLARGESSMRAERLTASTGVLPDRSRVRDPWRVKRGAAEVHVGMTSGARLFGERGCRSSFWGRCSSSLLLKADRSSGLSSVSCGRADVMQSARE